MKSAQKTIHFYQCRTSFPTITHQPAASPVRHPNPGQVHSAFALTSLCLRFRERPDGDCKGAPLSAPTPLKKTRVTAATVLQFCFPPPAAIVAQQPTQSHFAP
ncbi:MAG: hypothetical protein J6S87_04225 [Bacteroidales bacterium]|nr:hypothetical protein [Bacteroidales bacterium]